MESNYSRPSLPVVMPAVPFPPGPVGTGASKNQGAFLLGFDWTAAQVDGSSVTTSSLAVEVPRRLVLFEHHRVAGLEILAKLPALQHLDLTDTSVTDDGVKKLTAKLPRCKVVR